MKISVIGAGNVGGLLAARIIDFGLADVTLIDIKEDIAKAKAADISDSLYLSKSSRKILATSDFNKIKNSDIIVITAGFTRKPGMKREDLISKNAGLIKAIADQVEPFIKNSIVIIATNPLDLMTYYFRKLTQIDRSKLIGMGSGLDSARFAYLISSKLKVDIKDIDAKVIGAHGPGMIPLARLSTVSGRSLTELLSEKEIEELKRNVVERGAEIVSLYKSGSAYFAPSLGLIEIIRSIVTDSKSISYASIYLQGEYGLDDICLGVPVKIGKSGVEEIIQLDLNTAEKQALENLIRDRHQF